VGKSLPRSGHTGRIGIEIRSRRAAIQARAKVVKLEGAGAMMIRHPLVPAGYLTVPEALNIVEARGNINKSRAAEWLSVALREIFAA
jgi:hypothetical protein